MSYHLSLRFGCFGLSSRSLMTAASALLVMGVVCMAVAPDAEARERSRTGSYATSGGRTGTIDTTRDAVRGEGIKRHKDIQTGSGKGAAVDSRTVYTKGQAVTKDSHVSTNSGKTYGATSTHSYDKETGSYNSTVEGQNGKSVTHTGTAGDGQRTGSYTTSGGQSGSYDTSIRKTEDGISKSQSVTTGHGKMYDADSTKAYDRETKTLSGTRSGPRGKTRGGSIAYELNR